ncbi:MULTISPECIES: hypothetical protein [Protofrankia]|uniref:Uncharacterized protein n=1 Tax=Candidatus Protofrankia datiscae TaxID=2716812 RepID=F8B638_9ACTN|nr:MULTISPECIES: hypothetical protein [Protofrankia]AEH10243.1 hypothetical protein FsymDg_2918 [Candidatus Protofrankia datiscae]
MSERPDRFAIDVPPRLLVGLGGGILLLVVLAFAESLDLLAFAAVLSYLAIYLFSFVLLRPPPERDVEPAPVSTRRQSTDNRDQPS